MIQLKLRNIGNSKGIIIPKELLNLCDMEDEITMEVKDKQLIIRKSENTQIQWDTAFNHCIQENVDEKIDRQLMSDFPNKFDEEEWQW